MARMQRREFLHRTALAAGGAVLLSRLALAKPSERRQRLVVVIMRGAVDGLAAVPPYGDPAYARLRGTLAIAAHTGGD